MAKITQANAVSREFWDTDGKKSWDNYFEKSFLLKYLLQDKKGIYKTATGSQIKVPIRYDGNNGGAYTRGVTLNSNKRDAITAVIFPWAHYETSGTVEGIDEVENAGAHQEVSLIKEELRGAQGTMIELLAKDLYTGVEGGITIAGLNAATNATSSAKYAGYSADDIVSNDGTKVWTGFHTSVSAPISLDVIRARRTESFHGKGKNIMPDLIPMTYDLYNVLLGVLQTQQRYTSSDSNKKAVEAGFTAINFEGAELLADRFVPSGNAYFINTEEIGFAVSPVRNMYRSSWEKIANTAEDMTFSLYCSLNLINRNRRAHNRQSALTIS